ncbi:MAG: holo-ACP synthase [Clostridiales bacterium]|jgi:holo-[acyl-carrier protein] synthase|nr:holo-ACP synthase [Clostridiales bacterium]
MISGIGVDIIEIERVKKACQNERFLYKVFTESEIAGAAGKPESLAGLFAAKEAVSKAMGTGFSEFAPIDAEVLKDEAGKPYLQPHGRLKGLMEEKGITQCHVSISHSQESAVGMAVMEKS